MPTVTPNYDPASDIYIAYGAETASVTESTDGTTAPTTPAMPSLAVCGWMQNTPEFRKVLNNSLGFAVGSAQAAYNKRGARNPEVSMTLKVTHAGICAMGIRDRSTNTLPRLALVIGRPGLWTIALRDCKVASVAMSGRKNTTGEGQEIEAQVSVSACYTYILGVALNPSNGSLLRALGKPFFWHDMRTLNITDYAAATTNYARTVNTWSLSWNNNLTRKGLRPNFGDNSPFSITNEFLAEGNEQITGELGFDNRLTESMFNAAKESQDWGDIGFNLSTSPGVASGGKQLVLTAGSAFPSDGTMSGVESTSQLASTIPYSAQTVTLAYTTDS